MESSFVRWKQKNIMTKSSLPVGGYSVNPYVAVHMPASIAMLLL